MSIDLKAFEAACNAVEDKYMLEDDTANFHDVGALRGYISQVIEAYESPKLPAAEQPVDYSWIDTIEKLAWSIPAPNAVTPQLIQLCQQLRFELPKQQPPQPDDCAKAQEAAWNEDCDFVCDVLDGKEKAWRRGFVKAWEVFSDRATVRESTAHPTSEAAHADMLAEALKYVVDHEWTAHTIKAPLWINEFADVARKALAIHEQRRKA